MSLLTMSFGGHSPKPGHPDPNAQPPGRHATGSAGSTPREEVTWVSLADYEGLREVVKRLSADLRRKEEQLLEQQADLSILNMSDGNKSSKVPPFTGAVKDEYSADI